jgi:hypothetical protein
MNDEEKVQLMKWINVNDKLPEKFHEVLCFRPDLDEIIISSLCWMLETDPIWSDEVSNYTHWMNLPKPPTKIN